MLDTHGMVRILDFGLARLALPDTWVDEGSDKTQTGAIMGTIPYMSPEQAVDSKRVDARSDIYSLGCTLHFLLTGRPPYTGENWSQMFLAHRESPIPSLKAARRSVPDHIEDLFTRMLAKDPTNRPRTMASVIASIELAVARSRARAPSSQTIPTRHPDDYRAEPVFSLDDLKIEVPSRGRRRKRIYYVGRRLRPPEGPWDFRPLVMYLLMAGAAIIAAIVIIELLRLNIGGAKPADRAAAGDAAVPGELSPRR
jgi:serine/threonine protein kinase